MVEQLEEKLKKRFERRASKIFADVIMRVGTDNLGDREILEALDYSIKDVGNALGILKEQQKTTKRLWAVADEIDPKRKRGPLIEQPD